MTIPPPQDGCYMEGSFISFEKEVFPEISIFSIIPDSISSK